MSIRKITFTFLLALLVAGASLAQTPPFTRTVIVNNTGVPATDGAALLAAVAGLSPTPSFTNRWEIKLETGIYDVGSSPVVIPSYVNLTGSGVTRTSVKGSFGPPPGFLIGGVVQVASNSEIRNLTIECQSVAGTQESCQALSIDSGNPRLSNMHINVYGTGTGSHWGIRTFDAVPVIDDIEIVVDADSGFDMYGIVYGGDSAINMNRSSIVVRDGSSKNWAIVIKENLGWSVLREVNIDAVGGTSAAGIAYLSASTTNILQLDDCRVLAYSGSSFSRALHDDTQWGAPRIFVRGGRLYGQSEGVYLPTADVTVSNSEILTNGADNLLANIAKVSSSWLRNGTVTGLTNETCAGVTDASITFLTSTCP